MTSHKTLFLHGGHVGALMAVLAITALVGWLTGSDLLVRVAPGWSAMMPSTAVGFLLLAGALTVRRGLAASLAVATGCLAMANLALRVWPGVPGVDALLLTLDPGDGVSVTTTVGFLVAAAGVLFRLLPDQDQGELADYLALLGLSTSVMVAGGHMIGASFLRDLAFFQSMSLPTALLFSLGFLSLLMADGRPAAAGDRYDGSNAA